MKKTIIAFLVCTAATANAQKFEIGLNGGLGFNNVPLINGHVPGALRGDFNSGISGNSSVIALYNWKKFQFGMSIGMMNLFYRYLPGIDPIEDGNNKVTITIAKPAIPVNFILNRKVAYKSFEFYGGVSAGLVYAQSTPGMKLPAYQLWSAEKSGSGYDAGLQIGASYFITKTIGINAAVSADYIYLNMCTINYKVACFPATVGIRYKL